MWKKRVAVSVLGVLLFSSAGTSQARELAAKYFGEQGWNQLDGKTSLPLAVSFARVSRGAISFDLKRTGDIPAPGQQTICSFVDASGYPVLRLEVSWTAQGGGGNPKLIFRSPGNGEEYRRHGIGLWGPVIELDRAVARGASIHVDLTWDDEARRYAVYVDGTEQVKTSGGYDASKYFSKGILEVINHQLGLAGEPPFFESKPLSAFLSEVVSVRLGAYRSPPPASERYRSAKPQGARGQESRIKPVLLDALLENFVVYVDEIPAPGRMSPPAVASVEHNASESAFSGKLVAGDTLTVTMQGSGGATGAFDIVHFPDLDRKIALDWRGWGVYLEEKVFYEEGEVNLRDVDGYRVFAGTEPFDPLAPGFEPVQELKVEEQSYLLENLELDTPYYVAVVAVMRDGSLRPVVAPLVDKPLAETAPGVYTGSYQVTYQDRYPRAVVVGRLRRAGATASLEGDGTSAFAVDAALSIAVSTAPDVLKADEKSAAKVTVSVSDANGKPVAGHKIAFLLATTSQYTGVVGGGAFKDQVGGSMQESTFGETDIFGRLTATYVAGFAAKTAVIVARDMASNDTGAGWVKTYIQATAGLELVSPALAAGGYEVSVTSSEDWLTADGRSQAKITARVTLDGQPVEGHKVSFGLSGSNGSLRTVQGTTDRDGEARAVYTSGTRIGVALITATDTTVGVSGSVSIELRSDAPAKIAVTVDPAQLPADGSSRADLKVVVTDINDNPNENVEVEYRITGGGGRLMAESGVTGRGGESSVAYQAGNAPGSVSFEITVRSAAPTDEELVKARDLAVAVTDSKFL